MLARRIIPCLDVKDGRVVKGINFLQLRDAGDPVEQAAAYDAQGADEICYLDISASPEGRSTLLDVVARTADQIFAPLTVGGGVRTVEDAERLLDAGADKIAINTAAIRTPELVTACAQRFGSQAIVVAIDAKRRGPHPGAPHDHLMRTGSARDGAPDLLAGARQAGAPQAGDPRRADLPRLRADGDRADAGPFRWEVFSHGGRTPEGLDALAWCRRVAELGAGEILLTSMDRDGTGAGYDTELLAEVAASVSIPLIASGGVGELAHLADGLTAGADAVLAASIFHFGQHTIGEAKAFLAARGLQIRLAP